MHGPVKAKMQKHKKRQFDSLPNLREYVYIWIYMYIIHNMCTYEYIYFLYIHILYIIVYVAHKELYQLYKQSEN